MSNEKTPITLPILKMYAPNQHLALGSITFFDKEDIPEALMNDCDYKVGIAYSVLDNGDRVPTGFIMESLADLPQSNEEVVERALGISLGEGD